MDKYSVTFDRIVNEPPKPETEEEKIQRIKRSDESKLRKEKWIAESQQRPGIPGRSKLIDRNNAPLFISETILKEWINDENSELYYYSDISFLSGSAGYCLKKSDGTHLTQITMMS